MEELPDEVVQLNDLVAERLPRVELVEVLIEGDSWTGFTKFFRHAGEFSGLGPQVWGWVRAMSTLRKRSGEFE